MWKNNLYPKDKSLTNDLDDIDFQILSHLQKDGRKSLTDLATDTGLAVSTVRNRLARLLDNKIIQIIGRVEPEKVGFHVYARVMIAVRPISLIETVADFINQLPEVSFLARTSGNFDLELNVMCRNNDHLNELLDKIQRAEGVYDTNTNVYFKIYKLAQPSLDLVQNSAFSVLN